MKAAALLFIVLLILLGLVYLNEGRRNFGRSNVPDSEENENVTPTQESDTPTITDLIDKFYKNYENCMKNPPAEASGRVGEYCQNNSGLTTEAFPDNLKQGGTAAAGADPVVCAQDFPEDIKVGKEVQFNQNTAAGSVEEKMGPQTIKPIVEVMKVNGVWKISNIICP